MHSFISGCLFLHLLQNYRINETNIASVKIIYAGKGIDTNLIDNCMGIIDLPRPLYNDTTIEDRIFIKRLSSEINKLSVSNQVQQCDYRVAIILKLNDGSYQKLCMGEDQCITYEDELMKDSESLFSFINESLYENQPGAITMMDMTWVI